MWVFYEEIYYYDLNEMRYEYSRTKINNTIFTDYKTLTRFIEFTANEYYETLGTFERERCWIDFPDAEYHSDEPDLQVYKVYSGGNDGQEDLLIYGYIQKVKMQDADPEL